MRVLLTGIFCLGAWLSPAQAAPLTLDEVLARAGQAHPDWDAALAQGEQARADHLLAESQDDFRVTLEAALRTGKNPAYDYSFAPDHFVRLNARKPIWDAGRTRHSEASARLEVASRELQLEAVRAQRRLTLMTRFFDVLLTDRQYAADSEYTASAFVAWGNGRDRYQLGQLIQAGLAELEARYQEIRLRRSDAERKARERRALLAAAMNQAGELPAELAEPDLRGNDRPLPEFEPLWAAAQAANPQLRMQKLLLDASRHRLLALRADNRPSLELEAETAAYSRDASTRDDLRAGLNLVWPIYTGGRTDARVAREQAQFHTLQAQHERLLLELRQDLFETWQEVQQLRDVERQARDAESRYRDQALERARAEYELELKTNLGTSMADTQQAELRRRAVEYRLALAWERLAMLLGGSVEAVKVEEKP